MLDKIIEFFNNNPIKGLLLVLTVVALLIYYLKHNSHEHFAEHMKGADSDINTDNEFSKLVLGSKFINFKCKIGDTEYYLANIKKTSNKYLPDNCLPNETKCANSIPVLIKKTKIDNKLSDYIRDLNLESSTCAEKEKSECKLVKGKSEDELAKCDIPHPKCSPNRQFYHDFKIIDETNQIGTNNDKTCAEIATDKIRRRYRFTGTSIPESNGSRFNTTFNQRDYYEEHINTLCADEPASYNDHKEYANIFVIERSDITNDGGIMYPEGHKLRVKLRFNGAKFLTEKIQQIDQTTGKPVVVPTYIGYCDIKQCPKDAIVGSEAYIGICLYDDSSHPNVLEFEPIIIN